MSPSQYQPLFLYVMAFIALVIGGRYLSSPNYAMQEKKNGYAVPLVISIFIVFWLGFRPVSSAFGDTVNYAAGYRTMKVSLVSMDWHSEWIWQWLMMSCKGAGLSIGWFFTIVEAGYVLSAFWAVKRFMPQNPMLGMLFVWLSLMYFTFGVNGLRNGLACHLVLLAYSYLLDDKKVPGVLLFLIAFGIHRSVMLPIAGYFAARYFVNSVKYGVYFWLFSIFVSLVAGETVTAFFASLGFDDRITSYTATGVNDMGQFSKTGFRWDFLLYSAMPVLMAWHVCVKRGVKENWYRVLAVTYCLCNAFWVMVIRSSFSNRFAYLSWFLYPIVIAYPLINMPVWHDQDNKTGTILLCYGGFTLVMNFLYW